jgi:hypothetical protein
MNITGVTWSTLSKKQRFSPLGPSMEEFSKLLDRKHASGEPDQMDGGSSHNSSITQQDLG